MSNRRTQDPFEPERRRRRPRLRDTDDPREKKKRRRKKWPLLLFGAVVFGLVMPNLVGWLGLQKYLLDYALTDFQGTVSVRSASLGWFQPIVLQDVVVEDLAGHPMVTVERVETSERLYSFLTGRDYGTINLFKPIVSLHLRRGGSNLEDSVSRYVASSQPSPLTTAEEISNKPSPLPKVLVQIHEGEGTITSEDNPQVWRIDSFSAAASVASGESPLAIATQFRAMSLIGDDRGELALAESGTVVIRSAVDVGANQLTFSTANLEVESEQFPLSILAPISQRFIGPTRIGGTANGKVVASWNGTTNEISANVQQMQLVNAQVTAPTLLGDDRFFLDQLTARGEMQVSPTSLYADQFSMDTDFGHLSANGAFDLSQLSMLSAGSQLPDSNLQVQGEFDLARLLQRLPSTMKLHDDVIVESGTIQFSAGQNNEADARRLVVNVDTANIRASRDGQPIVWQQPLRIVGVVRESSGQFSIENFELVSDFLNVAGNATVGEGMFRANGDLGELSQRIQQFADLGEIQFSGKLGGQFGWQLVGEQIVNVTDIANQQIQIGGEFTFDRPVIEIPGVPRWSPDQVVVRTSGSGQLNKQQSRTALKLSQAGVQLNIGKEVAVLSLASPIEDAFSHQRWVFNSEVGGQLQGWLGHVRNFVDPGEFQATGDMSFAGVAIVDTNQIRIENGQYEIRQLGFDGYRVKVREDRVVGGITGDYAFADGNINVQTVTIQGSGISASAQDLSVAMSDAILIDGSAAWRADVNRVAEWLSLSTEPDSVHWFGAVEGSAQFQKSDSGTNTKIQAIFSKLIAMQRAALPKQSSTMQMVSSPQQGWVELWRESQISLSGDLNIGSDFDSLNFQQLSARSNSLDFDATGSIASLAGSMETNVSGNWQPNFEKINALLGAYSQNMILLAGNGEFPFRIEGPLFAGTGSNAWVSDQLSVQSKIGWEQGRVVGLPIGRSELEIDLRQQVAAVRTNGIPISGGMLNIQPQLDMRSADPVLVHGQARVLDRVQLTPEICRDGFRFVAPWLADTTSAEGFVSADLQGLSMPISDPLNVSARGSLEVNDVRIAAGPMADQLLSVIAQLQAVLKPESRQRELKTWLMVDRQTVPVAIENRRVYHEGIKFSHDDLVIRTTGSVGFDQTISLVAKIPIADGWLAGNRYLASLRGQSLSIPIGGTVSSPVIDQEAVRKLATDMVRNAAQGAIGNAISDKVNPKLGEFNNKLNGEVSKIQNQFQDKVGGFLQDKLGVPPNAGNGTPAPQGNQIEDRLNGELQKGLNKLFGG